MHYNILPRHTVGAAHISYTPANSRSIHNDGSGSLVVLCIVLWPQSLLHPILLHCTGSLIHPVFMKCIPDKLLRLNSSFIDIDEKLDKRDLALVKISDTGAGDEYGEDKLCI